MPDLTVVIPFVNEYPLICSTIRSVGEELRGRVDFEIIAVDNWCAQVRAQGREPDRGHQMVENMTSVVPWLRVLKYDKKLSHWQCKNLAVKESTSPFLFFCDAHVIAGRDSIYKMFEYYRKENQRLDGTIHLPLTYHLLEEKRLRYALRYKKDKGELHYTFKQAKRTDGAYEVPCMSSCGMMMTRKLYDEVGGWPSELGIYGGGENFINFTLSVLGKKKWVFGFSPIFHHGEKRGYNWNFGDYERNRLIATYMFGGELLAGRFIDGRDKLPSKRQFWKLLSQIITQCGAQRKMIADKQVIDINEWAEKWMEPNAKIQQDEPREAGNVSP
jgi:glycosyltransferase involved in cell wall biosynthesis